MTGSPKQQEAVPTQAGNIYTLGRLIDTIRKYLTDEQVNQVQRAYYFAEQAHYGQLRRSGRPYVTHPLAVAGVLAGMSMDHESLMAALLHDVIEDTGINKQALAAQFGPTVADLVDGVSKLNKIQFESRAEAQAVNFQKMALAMARDIRVILVKLADRLHNMRTLGVLRPEKRRRIARETLEIYAPIANRLGMNNVKVELETLGFAALYPMRSKRIEAAVNTVRGHRRALIETICQSIRLRLEEEQFIFTVSGREKHIYSIYHKMRQKHKSFSDIMDVFAVRIVVDTIDTCYRALGIIHSLYNPVPGQFKDYIAIPKSNGYQSLHTILFSSQGVPIEVQIRTHEMDDMAENGIAAHWLYKADEDTLQSSHLRARQWVQGLLDMQARAGNPLEFIEHVKIDLFPDEVYVFTPQGDILTLPKGSTAIDFAYAVHTDVGHQCAGCRINRNMAPLSEPLQSGQSVEILTSDTAKPSPAWLDFVATGKARSHIRHYLKHQRRSESVTLGQELLDTALRSLGSDYTKLRKRQIRRFLKQTDYDQIESVLEEIGLGRRIAILAARDLLEVAGEEHRADGDNPLRPLIIGADRMVVNIANCCHPIPGDHIAGHFSTEKGLVVHRDSCKNIADTRQNRPKSIALQWAEDMDSEFSTNVRLVVENKRGILAAIANRINAMEANIEEVTTRADDPTYTLVELQLSVLNRDHLARILRKIRAVRGVNRVTRAR